MINKAYLETLWTSNLVRKQLEKQARTTNGTYKINQTILKTIKIVLPPKELQDKFSNIYEILTGKKQNKFLQESENLFNSLLQKAFKGEL